MRDSFGKILWGYIHQYRKVFVLFILFVLIFAVVFSLYDLEVEAVFYAAALCAVLAFLWGAVQFVFYYKRHRALMEMRENILLMAEKLPAPRNMREKDYQILLKGLHEEATRRITSDKVLHGELIDYYTIWAHQIKTPIAAMYLLLNTEQDDDLRQEMTAELMKIEQYVDMVLGYMRLGSDSTDFVFRLCAVEPIVRQAIRRYAAQFIRKKIKLNFENVDISVVTDEKWLLFVIEQLLSNALKYTVSGSVSIYTEGKVLVIEDTGVGIAPEDLPRVCEKGFTGYNGRTDKKSTGIGLYLCKSILDKLGHTLEITSQVDRGTKVTIDLSRYQSMYD